MIVHSRPSSLDPVRQWQHRSKMAVYHGLDNTGSTDVAVSTLTVDRMLGHKVPLGLGFLGQASWGGMNTVERSFRGYVGLRSNIICSTPLCQPGSTLAQVAAGDFTSYYQAVAASIKAQGWLTPIMRIGWEFNGDYYSWQARGFEAAFIAAWQKVVDDLRAVSGWTPTFLWNPDNGHSDYNNAEYADPEDCYPGDDYVDFIGTDPYNRWQSGSNAPSVNPDGTGGSPAAGAYPYPVKNQENRWSREVVGILGDVPLTTTRVRGLAWSRDFALSHGKMEIYPEWGTGFDSIRQGSNCGDDAYYVARMGEWVSDPNVYGHGYWDRITVNAAVDYNGRISYDPDVTGDVRDDKPLAKAAFVEAFGYDEI
jgi:hypothetical protein